MSRWFDRAIEVAKSSDGTKKVGCVGVRKNKLVSESPNFFKKSHPTQAMYARRVNQPKRIHLHAEVATLIRAREEIDTLFVCRINKKGDLRMSKPCPICQLAIESEGISTVYYTTDKGTWEIMEL